MSIALSFISLSRVHIAITDRPNGTVKVERSANQNQWYPVRGGQDAMVVGGQLELDDAEFFPSIFNFYRVTQTSTEDNVQVFNTAGDHTWNKPAGLLAAWVRGSGPHGAGGGAATTAAGQSSVGGGGGEGGYFELWIPAADLPSSVPVSVGTGGVAVSGASGGAGGATGEATTAFSTYGVANGGGGGTTQAATSGAGSATGGTGGTATVTPPGAGIGFAVAGSDGYSGLVVAGSIVELGLPAPSHLGRTRRPGTSTAGANGQSGTHGPGSGGFNFASQGTARIGGGGGDGLLIVVHFFGA